MTHLKKRIKFTKTAKQERGSVSVVDSGVRTMFGISLSKNTVRLILILSILNVLILCISIYHTRTIHDNEETFSEFSNVEREITFRSEMGLYYYFYKSFINAESLSASFKNLIHERFVEFPDTTNALQRFNIYPEIIIGTLYKILNYCGLLSSECNFFKREDGFPYKSCAGLGEPIFFYLQFAWFSAGFTALFVFYFGTYLSKSAFGGLISLLSFFLNHAECSRVQWTPPLRETFAYPVLLLEMLAVSITMDKSSEINFFRSTLLSSDNLKKSSRSKSKKSSHRMSVGLLLHMSILSTLSALALMFWQLSQFILLTQFGIISFLYVCNYLTENFMFLFTLSQLIGLLVATFFLFFNNMLISSLFSCWIFATFIAFLSYRFTNLSGYLKRNFLLLIVSVLTFLMRHYTVTEDDTHIINLLKSKVTNFEDFHTLIYTCSAEYNFLPLSTLINLTYTGLLPLVIFVMANLFHRCIKTGRRYTIFGDLDAQIIYNVIQLGVFCIMAFFFMRLKLFMNPHLCVIGSLMASKYMPKIVQRRNVILILFVMICMSYQGVENIKIERTNTVTFTHPPLEELLYFINSEIPPRYSFAGPMTITAAILLSTQRPVVLHPHYEHVKIRNRTKDVYTIFSRKGENEVYEKLVALNVDFIVIDYMWCYSKSKMGCMSTAVWDKEDEKNRKNPSFCGRVYKNSSYLTNFTEIFRNDAFSILRVR